MYIYYPDLKLIFNIGQTKLKNPGKNDLFYYFISFLEIEEIIKLDKKFRKKYDYDFSDWYQVWEDLKSIYPNTLIRIQDIEEIGCKLHTIAI